MKKIPEPIKIRRFLLKKTRLNFPQAEAIVGFYKKEIISRSIRSKILFLLHYSPVNPYLLSHLLNFSVTAIKHELYLLEAEKEIAAYKGFWYLLDKCQIAVDWEREAS